MSNVYDTVTAHIVAELEKGTAPWVKPWKGGGGASLPYNAATSRRYNGVNVLLLWEAMFSHGYGSAAWLTFNQAKHLGGHVRKGEHGTPIVFAGDAEKETETGEKEKYHFLRFFTVFNICQVEGLPDHMTGLPTPRPLDAALLDADAFITRLRADIRHGSGYAAYSPTHDCILMPYREQFENDAHYFATSLHEHGHWTGHESRLARDLGNRFGDDAYAAEELVAELTAAFLCAELAIPGQLRHPEYIAHWLKVLGGDNRAIFTAAGKATEAANYMRTLANPEEDDASGTVSK